MKLCPWVLRAFPWGVRAPEQVMLDDSAFEGTISPFPPMPAQEPAGKCEVYNSGTKK